MIKKSEWKIILERSSEERSVKDLP